MTVQTLENNKYIPTSFFNEVSLRKRYSKEELHPLLVTISGFDYTADASDSHQVAMSACRQRERLIGQVKESDFSDSDKAHLIDCLNDFFGHTQLYKHFPEVYGLSYRGQRDDLLLSLANKEGELRLTRAVAVINKLVDDVFDNTDLSGVGYGTYAVKTPNTEKVYGTERFISCRIALSEKSHQAIQNFVSDEKNILEANFLSESSSALSCCINVGSEREPNYRCMNLLNASNFRILPDMKRMAISRNSCTLEFAI